MAVCCASSNHLYFCKTFADTAGLILIFGKPSQRRCLSRNIVDFGAQAIGGNVYAQRFGGPSIRLANIDPFNLNNFDAIDLLHITPAGNLLSVRSQEVNDGSLHINRFDFIMDTPSVMCLMTEVP